jgi:hypothetical protein
VAAGGPDQIRLDPEAESTRADERAVAQAEWLVGLGGRIKHWLMPSPDTTAVETRTAAPVETPATAGNRMAGGVRGSRGDGQPRDSTSAAQVDIGAAASLIVVGAVAYRLRQPLHKWWRRRSRPAAPRSASAKPFCAGPHTVPTRARAMARARKFHSTSR